MLIRVWQSKCGTKNTIRKVEKQLDDKQVYEEVSSDTAPLLKTIDAVIAKIKKSGDMKRDS